MAAALHLQYQSFGFVPSIDVVPAHTAAEALRSLDRYEEQVGQLRGDSRFKLHVLLPWAAALVSAPPLLDAVESVLGTGDILVWSSDINAKPANSEGYFAWHQDGTYAGLEPAEDVVTAWIALTPSTAENGALRFAPESHKRGQLLHDEGSGESERNNMLSRGQSVSEDIVQEVLAGGDSVVCELRPGQASLHHAHTLHTSAPNTTGQRRVGFAIRYMSARVRKSAGLSREAATLVRGRNTFDHFELEPTPKAEMDDDACAAHERSMQLERKNYFRKAADEAGGAAVQEYK